MQPFFFGLKEDDRLIPSYPSRVSLEVWSELFLLAAGSKSSCRRKNDADAEGPRAGRFCEGAPSILSIVLTQLSTAQ